MYWGLMSIVNRSICKKIKLTEERSDFSYWVNQSVETRLDALESLREEFNNWKFNDQQRFQRVYRVIKQK
jgi:hypothetical protein